jgi:hypothetical protein
LKTQNKELDFTADSKYHLSVIDRASSGTIDVAGHASGSILNGEPAISTTVMTTGMITPVGEHPIGGISTMQVYVIAAITTVIAAGIFLWSWKKWLK